MPSPADSLTRVALRLRAADRAALAAALARSVAVGDPPRPAPPLPGLPLARARVAAGVLLVVALGLTANYLGRLYTCAGGLSTAWRAMVLGFAALGVAAHRFAHLDTLVTADALRLPLPDRERLAAALRHSGGGTARAGRRPGLRPAQAAVAAGLLVGPVALGAADYALRLHACVGGGAGATRRLAVLGLVGLTACVLYVREALRAARGEAGPAGGRDQA